MDVSNFYSLVILSNRKDSYFPPFLVTSSSLPTCITYNECGKKKRISKPYYLPFSPASRSCLYISFLMLYKMRMYKDNVFPSIFSFPFSHLLNQESQSGSGTMDFIGLLSSTGKWVTLCLPINLQVDFGVQKCITWLFIVPVF